MGFRGQTSFNSHDSICTIGNRIVVEHDVPRRCEIVLRYLVNLGRKGISLYELTDKINHYYKCEYSQGDIRYAFHHLHKEGLAAYVEGSYRASRNALAIWNTIDKTRKSPKETSHVG
jgi:hypothetical protein